MANIFDSPLSATGRQILDSPVFAPFDFVGTAIREVVNDNSHWMGFAQDPAGITANDTWTNPVSIELVTNVTIGTLLLQENGLFIYTPPPTYIGLVTFQYRLWESGKPSNTSTVTITVNGDFIGIAVHEDLTPEDKTSQLIVAYQGIANRADLEAHEYSSTIIGAIIKGFTGHAIADSFIVNERISQLAQGFAGKSLRDMAEVAARHGMYISAFSGTAVHDDLFIDAHSATLIAQIVQYLTTDADATWQAQPDPNTWVI